MASESRLKGLRKAVDTPGMERSSPREGCILVVDDDEANVLVLTRMLQAAGYARVTGTTDAAAAAGLALEIGADVVLLDLMMPRVDGLEVLDQLKRSRTDNDCLAVLVVTGDVQPEAKHRALEHGAADVITKPYDMSEVVLRVDHQMRTCLQYRQLVTREPS